MKNILSIITIYFLLVGIIFASDFTPQGDIELRATYAIKNATNINGSGNFTTTGKFVGDGSFLTDVVSSSSNTSTYWDGYNDSNSTQFENSNGQLHIITSWITNFVNNLLLWASITGRPTVLSNFTDDLGDRGYTSTLNFTNSLNWINNSQETDSKAYNGTLAYNSSLSSYFTQADILAFGYYNSTDFVITDYFTKTQIENFNYYNSSDFDISDYLTSSQILAFNYYNSSNFNISDYLTSSQILGFNYWNSTYYGGIGNFSSENNTLAHINASVQFSNVTLGTGTTTIDIYNAGSNNIIDSLYPLEITNSLNVSSGNDICIEGGNCLSKNWNSTGLIINWSSYLISDNTSWNETYSNTLYSGIEWDYNQTTASVNILNGTGLIKNWNSTGFIKNWTVVDDAHKHNASNITAGTFGTGSYVMDTNLTVEKLVLENSASHYINDNSTCVFIRGSTSVIEVC